jgi:hypothetical protein
MSGVVYKPEQGVAESIRGSSFGDPECRYKRKGRIYGYAADPDGLAKTAETVKDPQV